MNDFYDQFVKFLNESPSVLITTKNRIIYNGKDIGLFEFHSVDKKTIEIDRLYLNKENQKQGIGSFLIKYLFETYPNAQQIVVYPSPPSEGFWVRYTSEVDSQGNFWISRSNFMTKI